MKELTVQLMYKLGLTILKVETAFREGLESLLIVRTRIYKIKYRSRAHVIRKTVDAIIFGFTRPVRNLGYLFVGPKANNLIENLPHLPKQKTKIRRK